MKRTFILGIALWLGAFTTVHAQVSPQTGSQTTSPTNGLASTVTGSIVPSGQGATGATGGSFSTVPPVAAPCAAGTFLSANLTAFGCASDPLSAPTYQIPAEAGATSAVTGPLGGSSAGARTVTPNVTSSTGGAGISSGVRCVGSIPSTAGGSNAGNLFGGMALGGC